MSGKLFIISAPSGAGKTSLVEEILVRLKPQYNIDRLVTYTSREIRLGEKEGIDFCFISPVEFEKRIQEGFFIEWSREYDHYYGSPKTVKDDLCSGCSRILVIDKNGAKQLIEKISPIIAIWISVSSIDVLEQRLLMRGSNSLEQIKKRLELARLEIVQESVNSFYKYHVLNENFDKAAKNLEEILVKELNFFL